MFKRRVVITGLGMITSLGMDVKTNWINIINGRSGITTITHFNNKQYKTKFGGIIQEHLIQKYFLKKKRYMDDFIKYGLIACKQAMHDSKISITKKKRFGVAVGSGLTGISTIEQNTVLLHKYGIKKIHPACIPATINNMLTGYIAIHYQCMGPSFAVSTGCATGIHNIGLAFKCIVNNTADVMIAGAAEKAVTPLVLSSFNAIKALSKNNNNPTTASRPWDKNRDGFVLSDGAGIIILEELNHAKQRNANIYAEIVGFGMSNDAYNIITPSKNGIGAQISMFNALKDAQINKEEVTYINAHATSTILGDISEVNAIKHLFKDHAYNIFISSTKSMTGHLLGASGAIESIFSILSLKKQIIPPTINLYNPDDICDLDFVPHIARDVHNMKYVLCNAFSFGGTNATLIFKKI
ncbi:beta-ketoacyl-ACP synthase II [Enterobacteriaceae endosymbiont of Macroplea mutica]|uniref:beta-ketoacyl-ACP synthase II n=1 Tax=Enterobacteriaceae endosymbiont of Macroplea mutica TaxID=2675791 RepID=UPI0014495B81|nr:beta-ketoacyl-ACP synthase II [Enterobacteriaceae endosymbiont of Macroplea mutica]QJC31123.1 beta-ketoacyl-ACP synthase II [Enterobacteriaceae endosymbiont of Macroplea mutica]